MVNVDLLLGIKYIIVKFTIWVSVDQTVENEII